MEFTQNLSWLKMSDGKKKVQTIEYSNFVGQNIFPSWIHTSQFSNLSI